MKNACTACSAPVDWETPTGKSAPVHMELQLSAFFGYGKSEQDSYLGLQAHGVLWAANPADTPANWPIAPPIVAGKVLHLPPRTAGVPLRGSLTKQTGPPSPMTFP